MPLPCERSLWEPNPSVDWSSSYRQLSPRKSVGSDALTLRHLLLFRQAKFRGETVDFADALADWCEHVDDLSTLLWLALTVDGDGQSFVAF